MRYGELFSMPFGQPPVPSKKTLDSQIKIEREEAWTGDAVLALYMRRWILAKYQQMDGEMFVRATSNDFLRAIGNPTSVEAMIGRCFEEQGLQVAFDLIETKLLPVFLQQEKVRDRNMAQKKGRK